MSEEKGQALTPEAVAEKVVEAAPETEKKESLFIEEKEVEVKEPVKEVEKEVVKEEEKKEEEVKTEEEKKEEEKKVEVKKEEELIQKKVDDNMSSRFSALSRKEKALRMKEKEIDEKYKKYEDLDDISKLAQDDPMAALKKIGLDYPTLTNFLLNEDKPEFKKMEGIEKQLQDTTQRLEQYEAREKQGTVDRAVGNFKKEITSIIGADLVKFELLSKTEDAEDIIYEIISQDMDKKKEQADIEGISLTEEDIMPKEKAAEMAEKYLEAEFSKYKEATKFAPKEQKVSPEPLKKEVPKSKPQVKEETPVPNTLTNQMATKTPEKLPITDRSQDIAAVKREYTGRLFEEESNE